MELCGRADSKTDTRHGWTRGHVAALAVVSIGVVATAPSCAAAPTPLVAVVASASVAPPPPPPRTIYGPIAVESLVATRAEVGWTRDLVRGELLTAYDVVLTQAVASCPATSRVHEVSDALGCRGAVSFAPDCTALPTLRARTELTARRPIDIEARCSGDPAPYVLPASGDVRTPLSALSVACFEQHNRFHPEASWESIYALTELRLSQGKATLTGDVLPLVTELEAPNKESRPPRFCRDDAAILDGSTPWSSALTMPSTPIDTAALAETLEATAPVTLTPIAPSALGSAPAPTWSVPLTNAEFRREHDLWEACADLTVRDQAVVQERCLLLRELDRFLREAEDQARPQTPRGVMSATAPIAPSMGALDAGVSPR